MGEGNGTGDRADRGAQFPMPWDLFGLLGAACDHRHSSHHRRVHRYMRMCGEDVVKDDGNGDGFDDDEGQSPKTMCACTGEG